MIDPKTPVAAVEYAASHYPGERFFHPYATGSYTIWAARDRLQVFVDGRYDLYAGPVIDDFRAITGLEKWEEKLAYLRHPPRAG